MASGSSGMALSATTGSPSVAGSTDPVTGTASGAARPASSNTSRASTTTGAEADDVDRGERLVGNGHRDAPSLARSDLDLRLVVHCDRGLGAVGHARHGNGDRVGRRRVGHDDGRGGGGRSRTPRAPATGWPSAGEPMVTVTPVWGSVSVTTRSATIGRAVRGDDGGGVAEPGGDPTVRADVGDDGPPRRDGERERVDLAVDRPRRRGGSAARRRRRGPTGSAPRSRSDRRHRRGRRRTTRSATPGALPGSRPATSTVSWVPSAIWI